MKQLDWNDITQSLTKGDFAGPAALLEMRADSAPNDEETMRLGFAVNAQMRNLPEAEKYLRQLQTKLGKLHGDILTARAQYAALVGNWDDYFQCLDDAFEARPADPAFCQRALCARLAKDGLFEGWAQRINYISNTSGYQPAHFLRGLHQIAITMLAINRAPLARELLLKLIEITDNPLTQSAALMDLTHAAMREGNTAEAGEYEKAFHALRSKTPAITQAISDWQKASMPLPPVSQPLEYMATVFVPTNLSRKIHLHRDIAPPKIDMLAQVLDAFYNHAKAPRSWPVIICYDMPTAADQQGDGETYLKALEKYVSQNPQCRLVITKGHGLRKNFMNQAADIRSPYMFMLEHDWLLKDTVRPLPSLCEALKARPYMHHVRYNLSPVLPDQYDAMLLPYRDNFTLTNGISNNPCMIRLDKVRRDWIPVLQRPQLDNFNMGAAGVEENIYAASGHIYGALGFVMGHQAFSTYLAAPMGAASQIDNLGI